MAAKAFSRTDLKQRKRPTKIYQNLSSKTIADITLADYDNLISNAYLDESNIEFLRDLATVIQFQQKPKGLQLTQVTQSGAVDSSSNVSLLEIPAGKTYDIQAVTCILVSTSSCQINYAINGVPPLGLDYLLKAVDYTVGDRGVTIDFSTMGDFLISGQPEASAYLVASRQSGTGSAIHNVFWREIN
jgi:hypothetical protein